MRNLDTCSDPLVGRIAEKWERAMIGGHFPGLVLMCPGDAESLRVLAGLGKGQALTFRATPLVAVYPGNIHQYGNILIGHKADLVDLQERAARAGAPVQFAELEEGDCWLLARWVGNVGETG